MNRQRVLFNPFIALSDVTIIMLVVITCLLMLFSAFVSASAQVERRKEQQAREIQETQASLVARAKRGWPRELTVLHAQGLQSYLYRFPGRQLFKPEPQAGQLSGVGEASIRQFARVWAPELSRLQERQVGALTEVQIQGHCSRAAAADPWRLSIERAMAAADLLRSTAQEMGFPAHLLSVCGYAWHRRAYEPSAEAVRKGKEQKAALEDRIDIILVFSGDQQDTNYVAAWDGNRTYGPLNDVSVPYVTDRR